MTATAPSLGLPIAPSARTSVDTSTAQSRLITAGLWLMRLAAEAGWITVIYAAAVVLIDHQSPALGPIEFAALVGVGVLVGVYFRSRPEAGAVLLIAVAIGAGILGWLAAEDARSLAATNPAAALSLHVSGWLGSLAAVRGVVVRSGAPGARQVEEMLRSMLPFVALVWAFIAVAAAPAFRLPFAVTAIWGTVLFISGGVLALGIGRLETLQGALEDRRARRRWRWLVLGSGLSVAPLAVPFIALSGIPVSSLLAPIVGPFHTVVGILAVPVGMVMEALVNILRPILAPLGPFLDALAARMAARPKAEETEPSVLGTSIGLFLAVLTVVLAIIVIFLIARWLLVQRRRDELDDAPLLEGEEHDFVVPAVPAREPGTGRRRGSRRGPVRDAVTAYVNTLDELDRHPPYARRQSETPAQHAARARAEGMPASEQLARLAAGYQLARYGGRVLTRSEDRRAVGRFERIRRTLRDLLRR